VSRGRRGAGGSGRENPYRRPDHFTKQAKEQGFPARSVFKLEEIDRRVGLLKQGQRVLDLGAAPGSWALYAAQRIGGRGFLVAIDLKPLAQALPRNARFLQADAFAIDPRELAAATPEPSGVSPPAGGTAVPGALGEDPDRAPRAAPVAPSGEPPAPASLFDVVLSDMAPSTTGTRSADQAQSFELFTRALTLAGELLKNGGSFVGKIFMGPDYPEAQRRLRALFEEVRGIRPEGTRASSFETFLVGLRRRPRV
jgi:23S rRNA (uridine2552-2'-O)-methyltransferase